MDAIATSVFVCVLRAQALLMQAFVVGPQRVFFLFVLRTQALLMQAFGVGPQRVLFLCVLRAQALLVQVFRVGPQRVYIVSLCSEGPSSPGAGFWAWTPKSIVVCPQVLKFKI